MRKITIPAKREHAEPSRDSSQKEAQPRPRLGLRYGANMEARARP